MTIAVDSEDGTTVLQLIPYAEPFGKYAPTARPT